MNARVLTALCLGAALVATPALAEFKPAGPVEVVVHSGPGGGNDVFARALIQAMEKENLLPVRFVVVNKVGGGSASAMTYIASKKNDPNAIALFTSVWITNPLVQPEATVTVNDLTPIANLVLEPALIVVRADSKFKTLAEFVDEAKKNPRTLKQSGGSVMARDAVIRQVLIANTKADWSFISFPTGGERISALLGGHVDMMVIEPSEAGELVSSGKLRPLAQIAASRIEGYADVPTLKEAGFDVQNVPQARGFVGGPDMPADAVAYYQDLFQKGTRSPSWQKYLKENHLEDAFLDAKKTREFLNQYTTQMRGILTEAGVKLVR